METFEYKGIWWLADRPEEKASGTLKYTPAEGAILDLIGSFKDIKDFNNMLKPEIILGISSDGKPITLYKCFEKSSARSYRGLLTSSFYANLVFVGAHFQDAKDIKFKSMSVYYSYLDEWVGISGFEIKQLWEGKGVVIRYKLPEPIRADISDKLGLEINFHAIGPNFPFFQINIEQKTEIKIITSEDTSFEDYRKLIFQIRNLLTLATMQSVQVLNIRGTTKANQEMIDDEVYYPPTEIFYKQLYIPQENQKLHRSEMLFSFRDISDKFEYFLKNWFENLGLFEPVYDLYFATLHNPHMYIGNKFLNLVQAIETFHRYRYGGKYLSDEEYKLIYNTLINAIPKGAQKELKERLEEYISYGNEFSLRKRMKKIIDIYQDLLNFFIEDRKSFIEKVVNTRNYLTHHSEDLKERAVKGEDLYYLTQKLKICLETCLLNEMGFSLKNIRHLFTENLNYQAELIK